MKVLEQRSDDQELIDGPHVNSNLLFENLRELDKLNRYAGGHAISLQGIKKLIISGKKTCNIVDLGCGSGDTLKYIAEWARKKSVRVRLTGVDSNKHAISYLWKHCEEYPEITGVAMDFRDYLQLAPPADIYICSLFCHHLTNRDLIQLFRDLKMLAKSGFVINDLHRNIIAYKSVWFLTRMFQGSELSKNDGPLSVKKAFTRTELEIMLREAGIDRFVIQWKWVFRYLVIVNNS